MALFTSLQADAAKVNICKSHETNGTHDYYLFSVEHQGLFYKWEDRGLAAESTKTQIKTAIHDYLIATEKKSAPSTSDYIPDSLGIEGNTVGSL